MKVSYNWLKEFVDIPVTAEKLADDLSLFGHEVEEVDSFGKDYVLNISITPNRSDCLSIVGIARDIAALYNLKLKKHFSDQQLKTEDLLQKINVIISEPGICMRFTARIINQIKIKKSPKWIEEKLKSYGFRSINNIVDITNLVMVELGQPLHAFDYDKINRGNVVIRKAKKNESLVTLDGIDRKLDENTIIIEDNKKIYDLAGIMGGLNSEIDSKTQTILLQGSVFNPSLIRSTSKKLKLTTDASYRFERKIDPNGTVRAVNYATELISESCQRAKVGNLIDIQKVKHQTKKIKISTNFINNLVGKQFSNQEIISNLQKLNINCQNNLCKIPSYRQDLTIWQSLAGEVIRVFGINKLSRINVKPTKVNDNYDFIKKEYIKDIMVENGFSEIYSYSFSDEKLLKIMGTKLADCRFVVNSITPDNKFLRPSLESSIISAIAKNPWDPEISIFEVGKVFDKSGEKWQLAIATTEKKAKNIGKIISLLNLKTSIVSTKQNVLDYLKIRRQVKYIIVDLDEIRINPKSYEENLLNEIYKRVSDFPPTIRDLAFVVNKEMNPIDIKNFILRQDENILLVELFDEYESLEIGENKKSIAFHIWIQDLEGPTNDRLVQNIINKIILELKNKYQANLRTK